LEDVRKLTFHIGIVGGGVNEEKRTEILEIIKELQNYVNA
tara:strand:+ start:238 stop:357 length:120 start_codon:yes stop_codon:yes gene_type:complete